MSSAVLLVLLVATIGALIAGGTAWLVGSSRLADMCWAVGTVAAILPALWWVIAALRHGRLGVDLIAVLALIGALAAGDQSPSGASRARAPHRPPAHARGHRGSSARRCGGRRRDRGRPG
jgi:hypothetical protein